MSIQSDRELFGSRLREVRTKNGWNQEYVAFLMVSHGLQWRAHTVSATELGTRNLTRRERDALIRIFGMQPATDEDLTGESVDEHAAPVQERQGTADGTLEASDTLFNQAIADLLKARREEVGITFDDLALATGIPRPTVARMIYGQRDLKAHNLRRLARALDISLSALLEKADGIANG